MKKAELIKLLKFLNSYYQQKFEFPKNDKSENKILQETWMMFLGEYNYYLIRTAVKKIVVSKEWPPTPGEILQELKKLTRPDEDKLTAGEAWELVIQAIRRHSYLYNPQKVKNSLPEKSLRAAEVVGLDLIAQKGGDSYVMNTYLKVYKNLEEKNREYEMLSSSMRAEVKQVFDTLKDNNNIRMIEQKKESRSEIDE